MWKQTADQQINELRKLACHQSAEAQGTSSDIRARSKATAFELWERSQPLRQGAQDVGEGLARPRYSGPAPDKAGLHHQPYSDPHRAKAN